MTEPPANCSVYPEAYVPVLTIETTAGNIDPWDMLKTSMLSGVTVYCSPALCVTIGCADELDPQG